MNAIAAIAANRVIGAGNDLPWRLPEDMARFKQLTMGGTLIVGRKTFESIDGVLPGRKLVVVTRQPGYAPPGAVVARTIDEALEKAGDENVWLGGGAEIYRQALNRCERIYLTVLEADFPGDAFFPEIDEAIWRRVEVERREAGERAPYAYRFEIWEKRRMGPLPGRRPPGSGPALRRPPLGGALYVDAVGAVRGEQESAYEKGHDRVCSLSFQQLTYALSKSTARRWFLTASGEGFDREAAQR